MPETENDKKDDEFLKQLRELNLKIDMEKDKIKQSTVLQEELENINASYNRCLEILARSAIGKQATQKYNDLYTQNRRNHNANMDELDKLSSEAEKNIDSFYDEREVLAEQYSKEETSN